jgi:hypothetical protein
MGFASLRLEVGISLYRALLLDTILMELDISGFALCRP